MNKETVKKNLKMVFLKGKELLDKRVLRAKAAKAEEEAEDNLREARGFLKKVIGNNKEVYVANIDGKDYKIRPLLNDEYDVLIEEIKIIK